MRPGRWLMRLFGPWCLLILLFGLLELWQQTDLLWTFWLISLVVLLAALLIDLGGRSDSGALSITRHLPGSLALGSAQSVVLHLANPLSHPVQLTVADHVPDNCQAAGLPGSVRLAANSEAELHYKLTPLQRGELGFGPVEIRLDSRWRLWQFRRLYAQPQQVRVYPNFAPIARMALLRFEQQIGKLGIHLQQRRGEGLEFHQLREFREGDAIRQVDWKATARARKPISREYQDDRDQELIFLLDCGRRMRAIDGELSHFDHALNATLLCAWMALRQGDAAGLLSFAGDERWVAPVKGRQSINLLMNQVYDLHSTTDISDFPIAAQSLLQRQRRRALVVLVSNIREEDDEDLRQAVELLKKHHVVMVASLRESMLDQRLHEQVADMATALDYVGTVDLHNRRQRLLQRLGKTGVAIVDSLPARLHLDMISSYLALKRAGRL